MDYLLIDLGLLKAEVRWPGHWGLLPSEVWPMLG